jgi:WD40 repeat protein
LVSFAAFFDGQGKLLTAGIDGTFIFDFDYRGKYDPQHAAVIDPEGKSIQIGLKNKLPLERMHVWAKGLRVELPENLVVTWSQTRLAFNDLRTGQLIHAYKDITAPENHITAVRVVLNPYKYFITGTVQGSLQVWKYTEKRRLIHSFEGHFKEVGSIEAYPGVRGVPGTLGDPALFLSSSLDCSVKVWSLDVRNLLKISSCMFIAFPNGLPVQSAIHTNLLQAL